MCTIAIITWIKLAQNNILIIRHYCTLLDTIGHYWTCRSSTRSGQNRWTVSGPSSSTFDAMLDSFGVLAWTKDAPPLDGDSLLVWAHPCEKSGLIGYSGTQMHAWTCNWDSCTLHPKCWQKPGCDTWDWIEEQSHGSSFLSTNTKKSSWFKYHFK